MKKQNIEWEKISAIYVSDKVCVRTRTQYKTGKRLEWAIHKKDKQNRQVFKRCLTF